MASVTIEPMTVPLQVDENGDIRVGGTRLLIDMIVYEFRKGASPEEIVDAFPVARLADVYAVIAYYLDHRAEIDAYIAERERRGEELRKFFEARIPERIRQRIAALRAQRAEETCNGS